MISCGARLAPFDIAEIRDLMSYDEMELDTIGDRKTALFVIISDTDDTFNFIVAMLNMVYNIYGNNETVRGIIWRFIPIRLTVPKNAQPNRYNKKTLYRGGPLKCHYQI